MSKHILGRGSLLLLAAGLAMALGLRPASSAAQKGGLKVEKVEYKGWKNNLRLSNGEVEVIVTLDVGPRVISYRLANGKNVFHESEKQLGKSGEKDWQGRGGHRLWVAPEDLTRTYSPDNGPIEYKQLDAGAVRLLQPPDAYGIQKEMVVALGKGTSWVEVAHTITNAGKEPTELAPWALSVMAGGGAEIIPLPPNKPHPGSPTNAKSPADFAPNQQLALWPYFDYKDPRYEFGSKYIILRQQAGRGPTKIGLAHRTGWVGYLNGGTLFVKRFGYEEGKTYPDNGCNFETFTNQDMLEIETLGPLVRLAPGAKAQHVERWELVRDVSDFKDEAGIDKNVLPKVGNK